MRTFDFLSPWEGADYELPGDEKSRGAPTVTEVKKTEKPADTGAGKKADEAAAKPVAPEQKDTGKPAPGAPDPTSKEGG
jgi:NADH-quinone oxidoreductase subunit C